MKVLMVYWNAGIISGEFKTSLIVLNILAARYKMMEVIAMVRRCGAFVSGIVFEQV